MEKKVTLGKLSRLQKVVLVMLCEPRYAVMKRREFGRLFKRLYWGKDSRAATASFNRALQRLEDRGYIMRAKGRWQLTEYNPHSDPLDNGVSIAFLVWAKNRELYAKLGLRGPPLEALGIKASTSSVESVRPTEGERPGVKVPGFDLSPASESSAIR